MFVIEIVVGVIIPLRLFFSPKIIKTPLGLFTASSLVIFGVLFNRINTFIVAYTPPYATHSYLPSIGEISVTVGFVSILVLLYRVFAINFPVISLPGKKKGPYTKYTVRGRWI